MTKDGEAPKKTWFGKFGVWLAGGVGTIAVGLAAVWVQSLLGPSESTMAQDLERLIKYATEDFDSIQGRPLFEDENKRVYHARFNLSGRCEDAAVVHLGFGHRHFECVTARLLDSSSAADEHLKIWRALRPGLPEIWEFGSSDDRSVFVADSPDRALELQVSLVQKDEIWEVWIHMVSRDL